VILVCVAYLSPLSLPPAFATPALVEVSVIPSSVTVGQSYDISFEVNAKFQGQAAATVEVGTCSGCSDVWKSAQVGVYSGQSYDMCALPNQPPMCPPAISKPGKYVATVMVIIPGSMGGVAIAGYANFEVTPSPFTMTRILSNYSLVTTQAQTANSTTVEASFDFAVSVSPTEQTVAQGQSASYVVFVDLVSGAPVTVDLSIQNLPAGISVAFDPQSGRPSYSSLLTVSTTQSTPPGQVALTVTGTGGGKRETADLTLIVSGGQAQTTPSETLNNSSQPTQPAQSAQALMVVIQQNSLIIIVALVVLVVIVAVVARGRKPKPMPKPATAPSSTVCASCGTQNSATDEFCINCGRKLA
jgi:hypothetical protein